jgi:hypothetical protein
MQRGRSALARVVILLSRLCRTAAEAAGNERAGRLVISAIRFSARIATKLRAKKSECSVLTSINNCIRSRISVAVGELLILFGIPLKQSVPPELPYSSSFDAC